ncbi:hypothetical protein PSA7680_02761 [Pseudoruegeria aquimaris]|uniref:Glycosyl transferase family 8 n=1 Tax=Pseudoruegeria aquimaris TaxID=393663 RepID=A0A1Y5T091_9RHOB|nr:hypothetical protein [Pseudoruegeria aquimaris]SLN52972.1 hypothetical protein PSA7680_02761 [Pseudoruegeria aquimaris]
MQQGTIQIVFVKWGSRKYSSTYVNGLVDAILARTKSPCRFVCLTEDGAGLDDRIETIPFPDLGLPLETLTSRGGSLPKMGIFKEGILHDGYETLYIDLDSAILGDVQDMADCLKRRRGLYLLQRHVIPYWRFQGLVDKILPERFYLGNTALMAFYPEDWRFMAEKVREEYPAIHMAKAEKGTPMPKLYAGGNEYLISAWAGRSLRVFPKGVAVKFTQEYMAPFIWAARLKDHMPWIKARRARQAAVTFHGEPLKPKYLVNMKEGDYIGFKHHHTRWHYPEITDYWREVLADEPAQGDG